MKIQVQEIREVDVAFIKVVVQVRYWEDATVNGDVDEDGNLMPCRNGDCWCPVICLESGIIMNWEQGKSAKVHYKVCDAGVYALLDKDREEVKTIDGYVPEIMCPRGGGFGDYIIMDIDADGAIQGWKPTLDEWEQSNDQ